MSRTTQFQRRLFDQAVEPEESCPDRGDGRRRFFVQKHDATRLHYDFRLEHAGVLKSWAMPIGPCLDADVSRAAALVKDHAIEYGDFEGTIPAGVYGGGTVMVWDRGIWLTDQDVSQALYVGELTFRLHGQKLSGVWSLTRLRPKPGDRRENWLLKKAFDEESRPLSEVDILIERPESVRTGRTLTEIACDPPLFVPAKPGTKRGQRPAPNQLPLFPNDIER